MIPKSLKDIPFQEQVFCNRSLNLSTIKAIGFDLDYTLVRYIPETFEKLAFHETTKKLVELGYPKEILDWEFDHNFVMRGLIIDKNKGNILKIDRHRYVKIAYHGFQVLSSTERKQVYDVENVINYEEPHFSLMDTTFSIPEGYLFLKLVDLKERSNHLKEKSYFDFYHDTRTSINLCHRDGSIKTKVAQNPHKYIKMDEKLPDILIKMKESGVVLFILTNSLWKYADSVMGFLLNNKHSQFPHWTDYFHGIFTGSRKPNFFTSKNPLYEVDRDTELLKNIERVPTLSHETKSRVFQEGNTNILKEMLKIQKGSQLLYIGDHIYGDILRSKKEIGWRTMLVIEELEEELIKAQEFQQDFQAIQSQAQKEEDCEDHWKRLTEYQRCSQLPQEFQTAQELEKMIQKASYDLIKAQKEKKKMIENYHKKFHPIWGQIMKAGRQNSKFAAQVESYACLYTTKLSNLLHYGMEKSFRAARDVMPHEVNFSSQDKKPLK